MESPTEPTEPTEPQLPLDLEMWRRLESQANALNSNVMGVTEQLQQLMVQMAATTSEASQVHSLAMHELSATIDACTDKTVKLIAACDELDKDLEQLPRIARNIKTVLKLLDQLQKQI
ncbi:hypothetical protein BCR43DRAFT_513730 [Syncephalastrum racemosum]|uniref:BLOC-1-related complex subunit 6 C-terminal helix domain-containing protein n=1 Tax=Syncephalastrum racemosum TaxID=13706 RepID=A0A1X2HEC4_SYNRA|nr:hypothetical protein BCR43DRAFT_513730 [Syncephalastrum racemosum]